jgi:multidrug efflux pump subunit AcrB
VVKVESSFAMLSISRVNRERAISIFANPAPGFSQQEGIEESLRIAKEVLPEGYYAEITGSAKTTSESFDSLFFVLVVGIIASYMILASQFNSFIHPFIILLSLPFSFSGALFALYLTGQSINIFSFIGLILLMGLVKKNSILLVEFTNQIREEGTDNVTEALLAACPIRLRPILMTSISTIAASIPPALALGPGAETRIPMAVAVLGGIIFSTLLTLFVVPCAYSLMARWEKRVYINHH